MYIWTHLSCLSSDVLVQGYAILTLTMQFKAQLCLIHRKSRQCKRVPAFKTVWTSSTVEKRPNMVLRSSVSFLKTLHSLQFPMSAKIEGQQIFASFSVCKIHLFCSPKEVLVSWKRWLWSLLKNTSIIMCAIHRGQIMAAWTNNSGIS